MKYELRHVEQAMRLMGLPDQLGPIRADDLDQLRVWISRTAEFLTRNEAALAGDGNLIDFTPVLDSPMKLDFSA